METIEAIYRQHEGDHIAQPCYVGDFACDVQTLQKALKYALRIIDAYALECRGLPTYLAEGNSPEGFCGGDIFTEAHADIVAASAR